MRRKLLLILFLAFLHPLVYSQQIINMHGHNLWVLQERDQRKVEVFEAASIVYYGLDFSLFSMTLDDTIRSENEMIQHVPAWIKEFEMNGIRGSFESALEKFYNKPVHSNKVETQSSYEELPEDWLNAPTKKLEIDTLRYLLQSYPTSELGSVGFTIVVESFEERTGRATTNFLFFNVKTKEILWNIKMLGLGESIDIDKRWGLGLKNAFSHFRSIYTARHRNYIKMKRKSERKIKTKSGS